MYHLGVVKALFEQNLLPKVICGTSIGALIVALLGALFSCPAGECPSLNLLLLLCVPVAHPSLSPFVSFAGIHDDRTLPNLWKHDDAISFEAFEHLSWSSY